MKTILQNTCVNILTCSLLVLASFSTVSAAKGGGANTVDDGPSIKNITVYTTNNLPVKVELTNSSTIAGYSRTIQSSNPSGTYTITYENGSLYTNLGTGIYTVTYSKTKIENSRSNTTTLTQLVTVKNVEITYPPYVQIDFTKKDAKDRFHTNTINALEAAKVSIKIDNESAFDISSKDDNNGFYLKFSLTNYDGYSANNDLFEEIKQEKTTKNTKVTFVVLHKPENAEKLEDNGSNADFNDTHENAPTETKPDNTITLTSGSKNQVVCLGTSIASNTYSTTGATGVIVSGLPSGVEYNFSDQKVLTLSGTSTVLGTFTYTISLTGGTGSVTTTGTITVNALPTASISGSIVICQNSSTPSITFTGAGATAPYVFSYTLNGGASQTITSTENTATVSVPTNVAGNYSYVLNWVKESSATACSNTVSGTASVTVNPTPTVDAVTSQVKCNLTASDIINFSGTVSGTSYAWTNSNTSIGIVESGSGNISSVQLTNSTSSPVSGKFSVTPTANSCVGAAGTFTVTVNPTPTVEAVTTQVKCNLTASDIINFSGTVSGTSYTWTNSQTSIGIGAGGSGDISSVTLTNSTSSPVSGTFLVTPTANGCDGAAGTFTVTVNPTPETPKLVASDNGNNFSANIILTATVPTLNFDPTKYTYYWYWDNDISKALTPTNSDNTYTLNLSSNNGIYTVQVRDGKGCLSAVSNAATIAPTGYSPSSMSNPSIASSSNMTDGEGNDETSSIPANYVMESSANDDNIEPLNFDNLITQYIYDRTHVNSSYTLLAYNVLDLGDNNIIEKGAAGIINPYNNKTSKFKVKSDLIVKEDGAFIQVPFDIPSYLSLSNVKKFFKSNVSIDPTNMPTPLVSTKYSGNYINTKEEAKNIKTTDPQTLKDSYRNLTLQKGTITTLTGNAFGTLKIEQGADVTFDPLVSEIYIKDLQIVKGPINGSTVIRFTHDVKINVSDKVNIGSNVWFNPTAKKVTFYYGSATTTTNKENEDDYGFFVKGGKTNFNANVFAPNATLNITGGYAYGEYGKDKKSNSTLEDDEEKYANLGTDFVNMSGFFIANKIISKGKNIKWSNQPIAATVSVNPFISPFGTSDLTTETVTEESIPVAEGLTVTVAPNPSSYSFTIKVASKFDTPYSMIIQDASANVVESRTNLMPNAAIQIGQSFRAGIYYLQIIQNDQRKVVRLVKVN